jgi:hypothetical protein
MMERGELKARGKVRIKILEKKRKTHTPSHGIMSKSFSNNSLIVHSVDFVG